ncbi:Bifunctional monodehydroascorbate reductase and carbonic anhydrase nectarin-3 [Apostasia shenzhenica]|uniref:Carbonic anhydrase n=1 Tax=Apostasia shenzhenica TaxID=1088818 RepID=A0A2H9ZW89_9ASPA|nr:Bifunctional monodehydroascorbate reductase and carbonic anhydrase nectarin-3 [Apostasia shenzhenica]
MFSPSFYAALLITISTSALFQRFASYEYTGNGPANWGDLSSDYRTCSTGEQQSPININKDDASVNNKLHDLDRLYVDADATLINNGFNLLVRILTLLLLIHYNLTIILDSILPNRRSPFFSNPNSLSHWDYGRRLNFSQYLIYLICVQLKFDNGAGFLTQDGKNYTLKELHWHAPSEHTIDKEQFPLELHLVHRSNDGNVAVVAILYDFGNPDPFIYQLKDKVEELGKDRCSSDEVAQVAVSQVRTKALKRHSRKFFKYVGSRTTPPCTENVTWYILGKVRKVSKDQIALIKSPLTQEFQNNARPVQPLNGRTVELKSIPPSPPSRGLLTSWTVLRAYSICFCEV